MDGASDRITEIVLAWPGTTATTGERGEWSFRLGKREIGHLHGDRVLHIGLTKGVWQELFDAGRIGYHPVFPGKAGFGARDIATETDEADVLEILREQYERMAAKHPEAVA